MKKLLSLLSVLTISGTAIPTTIAASPYQKEEINLQKYEYKIENNQNNNEIVFKKLKRSKRGGIIPSDSLLPSEIGINLPKGIAVNNNPPSKGYVQRTIKENSLLPYNFPQWALNVSNLTRQGATISINTYYNGNNYIANKYISFISI